MSMSARNNSRKELGQNDSGVKLARKQSAGKTVQENSLDIRARCDALRGLSDDELLSGMETVHGEERTSQLKIVLYLGEIERRRFYVARGYGTLFDFCTDTYNYSRSTAWRRISAARCVQRFPRVGVMLLSGKLSLTVISMIAGILTAENADEILSRVRGKSFRDVELLVARHSPEKVIRDRIRPVFVMSPVSAGAPSGESTPTAEDTPVPATVPAGGDTSNSSFNVETKCAVNRTSDPGPECDAAGSSIAGEPERVMVEQKYKLEFSVNQDFVKNLNRIKSILSTKYPKEIGFEKLFDILMTEYLAHHSPENRIKKRKRCLSNARNKSGAKVENDRNENNPGRERCSGCEDHGEAEKMTMKKTVKRQRGTGRNRHIPQVVRDEVFARDGGRCTFISKNGRRCGSTWNIQIDHVIPYAKGGDHSPENLRLLCERHNKLAAEREFGAEHMEKFYKRE